MLNVFVSRDDLKAAVAAWIDGKAAAEAKHGSISSWDVSRVNDFSELFCGFSWCEGGEGTYNPASMFNGDVGSWDTSKVMTMYRTFGGAKAFNSELVWDTSKVTTMDHTFWNAEAFNQPLDWDTSKATMRGMLYGTQARILTKESEQTTQKENGRMEPAKKDAGSARADTYESTSEVTLAEGDEQIQLPVPKAAHVGKYTVEVSWKLA